MSLLETILARPRYWAARSKAETLASRQEGATAESSKLRLSIAIQQSGERDDDVDLPVRDRGDDFLLPLCSGGCDERRGLICDNGQPTDEAKVRNKMPRDIIVSVAACG
jgi:hypothetical protein